jgi:hypothetical protein
MSSSSRNTWHNFISRSLKQQKRLGKARRDLRSSTTARPQLEVLETRELLSGGMSPHLPITLGGWLSQPMNGPVDQNGQSVNIGPMILLSDGTVMAQQGGTSKAWYRLTPDLSGSYANGTWSQMPSMSLEREYFTSALLPSGNLFVLGGEYSGP